MQWEYMLGKEGFIIIEQFSKVGVTGMYDFKAKTAVQELSEGRNTILETAIVQKATC